MNFDDLVQKKLVLARPHERLPITLYKYHRKVFYTGLFSQDERLRWARGIALDRDGEPVIRPFYKFYNAGENDAGDDWNADDAVLAVQKMNGFMMSASRYNDEIVYASTGTFDSDYVELGKRYIELQASTLDFIWGGDTCVFEICATEDPHIIDERIGAYLIGILPNHFASPVGYDMGYARAQQEVTASVAETYNLFSSPYEVGQYGDFCDKIKTVEHEGYMLYNMSNPNVAEPVIKMKSPYYLVTKLLAHHALHKDHEPKFGKLRNIMDEEYYPLLEHLKNNRNEFFAMGEQERIAYLRMYFNLGDI